MTKKVNFNRYKNYDYKEFENLELTRLQEKIILKEKEIGIIEKQIKDMYDNCEHEYYFSSMGAYDDCYCCIKCGNYEWN